MGIHNDAVMRMQGSPPSTQRNIGGKHFPLQSTDVEYRLKALEGAVQSITAAVDDLARKVEEALKK